MRLIFVQGGGSCGAAGRDEVAGAISALPAHCCVFRKKGGRSSTANLSRSSAQTLRVDFQKASSDFHDFPRFYKVNSVNFENLTTNRFSMVEGANAAVSDIKADAVSGEVLFAPLHPPALESFTVDG